MYGKLQKGKALYKHKLTLEMNEVNTPLGK